VKYGRFFGAAFAVLVGSVLVYVPTWWFAPKEDGDPALWQDVLIWVGAIGFFASVLALVGGVIAYAVKGPVV
jgi:hypothetical protein